MQAKAKTFTESARRAQIVAAAIETIASLGYAKASFAQIAKEAKLSSTGLISYHFANKEELVRTVLEDVFREIGAFMAERMSEPSSAGAALRTYLEANLEFAAAQPTRMRALLNIFLGGALDFDAASERAALEPVERILRWGQESGEFREFDVRVMATTVRRSVEGPVFLLAGEPTMDLTAYAEELVTLFDLATRRPT
ncbi:TetR/AcrR family transcriptional regulator [Amycolatopsis azurea]|uniref:TetR family transcriptional regulator n=1 Tax=Amycolatopsis azurea DSM 43854 TaxID=1238180 RepID=A0ABX3JKX9_9PSEU|nr:TetR family transcriptional regulator [Amycolatopsis azurea]OOC08416.1 TetR family transcriptional regulator [Amycolatopsis azurea DSM 43854]